METVKQDSGAGLDTEAVLNATLIKREDVNDYLSIVRVQPDELPIPEFKPGQFATLGLPRPPRPEEVELLRKHGREPRVRITRRAYSIASPPTEREYVELFVILVKEGKLTPQLWDVEAGGRLWMHDEIKGEFTLDGVPPGKDLVMFSTGTGLAPFLSMYRAYRGQDRWRSFTMVNGVRHSQDLGYRAELEQLEQQADDFSYIPLVSRSTAGDGWHGLKGRVQMLLERNLYEDRTGRLLDPEDTHVFLCGNPAMIDEMEQTLLGRGFTLHTAKQPGNLHFERYW